MNDYAGVCRGWYFLIVLSRNRATYCGREMRSRDRNQVALERRSRGVRFAARDLSSFSELSLRWENGIQTFSTAASLLSLALNYRYLPIYER